MYFINYYLKSTVKRKAYSAFFDCANNITELKTQKSDTAKTVPLLIFIHFYRTMKAGANGFGAEIFVLAPKLYIIQREEENENRKQNTK